MNNEEENNSFNQEENPDNSSEENKVPEEHNQFLPKEEENLQASETVNETGEFAEQENTAEVEETDTSAIGEQDEEETFAEAKEKVEKAKEETTVEIQTHFDEKGYYEKCINEPLNSFESADFFKKGFNNLFTVGAIGLTLYGFYLIAGGLFGDNGYIDRVDKLEWFPLVRSIALSVVTLLLSIFAIAIFVGIMWKRSSDFRDLKENNMLYVFPRLIKTIGELFAFVPFVISLFTLCSVVFVVPIKYAFVPAKKIISGFANAYNESPFADYVSMNVNTRPRMASNFSEYFSYLFSDGFGGVIMGLVNGFIILFACYLFAEAIRVVLNFLIRK